MSTQRSMEELIAVAVSAGRLARFRRVAGGRLNCLTLLFERFHDPRNVSACLRTAEAFGIPIVHVVSDRDWSYRGKAATCSHRWVEVVRYQQTAAAVAALRAGGFTLVGTVPAAPDVPAFDAAPLPPRTALVLGCEHSGMSNELRAACSRLVTIPTQGFMESLNVSVAAGILIEHLAQGYRASGREVTLSVAQQEALVRAWCEREVTERLGRRSCPPPTCP